MAWSGDFSAAGYDRKYLIERTDPTGARLFEPVNTGDANFYIFLNSRQAILQKETKKIIISSAERCFPNLLSNEKVCVACKGAFPLVGALSRGVNS